MIKLLIFQDTIGKILTLSKDKCTILIKDTDEKLEIKTKNLQKYDMKYIIDTIQRFILKEQSKIINKYKEIINEDDLHLVMDSLGYEPLNKGYYDSYNRLSFVDYKEKMETLKKERQDERKTMKADFAGRREVIIKQYNDEKYDNSSIKPSFVPPAVKNIPDQKNNSKDKKKKRKP